MQCRELAHVIEWGEDKFVGEIGGCPVTDLGIAI